MPSHKRRAEDSLLPTRAPKQARTAGLTSPTEIEGLGARWARTLGDAALLVGNLTRLSWETLISPFTGGHTLEVCKPDEPPTALPSPPPSPPKFARHPPLPTQAHARTDPIQPPRPSFPQAPPVTDPSNHPEPQQALAAHSGIVSPPASHATSSTFASSSSASGWQRVGQAVQGRRKKVAGNHKAYISREHIHQKRHKARVQESWKKDREAMERELYEHRKNEGYKADFETFQNYARYRSQLELQRLRETLTPSRSVTDLRSPPTQALENRRHSFHDDFLQRALQRARKSLDGPKAPQYTPNFDDLRKDLEAIDKGIDYRIHGQPIPSSLPPEDDAFVDDLLERQGVIAKCGREQVTDRDISRLQPHQWLNDEIINFYGQMILDRSECKENPGGNADGRKKSLNVHYFSTFFWTKLKSVGYEKGRLAKWTKKIDIFSKNIVLIPVNHNNAHWTAAAINFDKKRIESHDSMGMGRQSVFDLLRKYLDAEHRNKKNKPFDFDGWSDYFNEDLPQQENGWDCGVFTCQFLESLSRGEERFTFQQDHMPYVRRRMLWEIGKVKLRDGP